MRIQYERTSISLPSDILGYLKGQSDALGIPVSRLIAQAIKMMRERREPKRRAIK